MWLTELVSSQRRGGIGLREGLHATTQHEGTVGRSRVWFADKVVFEWPMQRPRTREAIKRRTQSVIQTLSEAPNHLRVAVIDQGDSPSPDVTDLHGVTNVEPHCSITRDTPQYVEVTVRTSRSRFLVLADRYNEDWVATLRSVDSDVSQVQPICRANEIMRVVEVPAGESILSFEYRPWAFWIGAQISSIAWIALGATCLVLALRRRRRKTLSARINRS